MAAVELDPQFVKALRLLRSKSKDSGAQLRAMLDDAIRQKKGLAPRSPSVSKQHSRSVSSDRDKERSEKEKKKDLDRLKKDLSELVDKPSDPKRARLDSPALSSTSLSHSPSPTSISPPPKDAEHSNSGSSDNMEYGDLEMNLEFDCSCCVCKSIVLESGNSLMECNTCQNLYHQMCHNPPVTNDEAKDPRLIWNCMKCTRNKEAESGDKSRPPKAEKPAKGSSSSASGASGSGSSARKSSSSSKSKSESRGGSSLASGKSGSGSSANSSSSSGTGSSELSSSAKKRLKLLKKQAAASTVGKKKSAK